MQTTTSRRTHRTLKYCDDTGLLYGWWCRDCPEGREPWTRNAGYVDKAMARHKDGAR